MAKRVAQARRWEAARQEAQQNSETGWRLLKIRDLRWLWMGQAISQIGDGLNKVALLYLVFNLTNSTLMMTIIGVLQTLPPLLLSPVLGVYVDRFPKKWLMMGTDAVRAGLALIIPLLYAANALTLPRVYGWSLSWPWSRPSLDRPCLLPCRSLSIVRS